MSKPTVNDTKRERFLLMLFPAAIVLAIYSVVFALPLQRTKAELEAKLVGLSATAISEDEAGLSLQMLSNEKQSLERLKKKVASSKQQVREMSQSWRSRTSRLETLEKISELMRDFNLTILSQGADEKLALTTYLTELFQIMDRQSPEDPVQYWQVKVQGTYFEVVDFLTAVDATAKKIIPIGITMESESETESPGSSRKNWTIFFVI